MPVTAGTSLLELLLALLGCLAVPVLGVDIIGDDAVSKRLHCWEHVSASGEVRRAHVGWLHTDNVDEGLLKTRHLGCKVVGREGAEVLRVGPSVGCDLVASFVGILESALLVVDTSYAC